VQVVARKVKLSDIKYRILARMPWTSGSRPAFRSRAAAVAFQEMINNGLIDGYEGCYYVRWGWLSRAQSAKLADYRQHLDYTL